MNMEKTITPKSDQLNADDLIGSSRTITITEVVVSGGEQPVHVHYEGENGRPYKPSKSMRRVLVALWGLDSRDYVGKRITLYRDLLIKFGGEAVGGIRISHASGIDKPMSMPLTESRAKRKTFVVEPLRECEKTTAPALADLPGAWDSWTLEERGINRSRKGMEALEAWFKSMPAEGKKAVQRHLAEWKETAATVDESKVNEGSQP